MRFPGEAALPYIFVKKRGERGWKEEGKAGAQLSITCLPGEGNKVHMKSLRDTCGL
jgi:hypothetical protein